MFGCASTIGEAKIYFRLVEFRDKATKDNNDCYV